jgi:hypothetical protein
VSELGTDKQPSLPDKPRDVICPAIVGQLGCSASQSDAVAGCGYRAGARREVGKLWDTLAMVLPGMDGYVI